jgi:hypothetical protein
MRYPEGVVRDEHHERRHHPVRDVLRTERRRSPDSSKRHESGTAYRDRDRDGHDGAPRERGRFEHRDDDRGRDDYRGKHNNRDWDRGKETRDMGRRYGRHESDVDRLPSRCVTCALSASLHIVRGQLTTLRTVRCRPSKREIEGDPSVQASSFTEYRLLKRQKMAERCEWLIWERSPPPMDEPLLQEQDDAAEQNPDVKDAPVPVKSAQEEALDQEELQLFWYAACFAFGHE